MKRSPMATMSRTVRRGLTWRPKHKGRETIDIAALISPLRYDVAVRAQFFTFLSRRPAGESDEALVQSALLEPYAVWFRHIAMARFRPWVLKDDALFEGQFTERVLTARALFESVLANGFDARHPVTLRGTTGAVTSDTGAVIRRTIHVGDGGHRLAVLMSLGRALEPEMYVVDPRSMPVIDNTGTLVGHLGLREPDYAGFLAQGYGLDATVGSLAALRALVGGLGAQDLAELDSVIAAQRRTIDAVRGPSA